MTKNLGLIQNWQWLNLCVLKLEGWERKDDPDIIELIGMLKDLSRDNLATLGQDNKFYAKQFKTLYPDLKIEDY